VNPVKVETKAPSRLPLNRVLKLDPFIVLVLVLEQVHKDLALTDEILAIAIVDLDEKWLSASRDIECDNFVP
jgi:hypothetical protein